MKKSFFIAVKPVGSKFAKALQQALQGRVVNKVYRALPSRVKAGRSQFTVTQNVLNKVQQFERFRQHGVTAPAFCLSANDVAGLGAKTVFARTLINSTNGRGIVEFEVGRVPTPAAPLYTEYIPKKAEYRFHVFAGEVIDVQQKKKKRGFEDNRDTRIRNLHNGYIYCRDNINAPNGAAALAVNAVNACGYQYGAVDIIYNEKRNQCYVLEVNSRPGLMGTTLDNYANALVRTYNLERK